MTPWANHQGSNGKDLQITGGLSGSGCGRLHRWWWHTGGLRGTGTTLPVEEGRDTCREAYLRDEGQEESVRVDRDPFPPLLDPPELGQGAGLSPRAENVHTAMRTRSLGLLTLPG